MALYITDKGVTHSWHVGEPLPKIEGRVVTFQADGDELAAILEGLGYDFESVPGRKVWDRYTETVTPEIFLGDVTRSRDARDRDEEE